MEIEKERGISVTSSVMQFNYDDYCINILDTPGHQDFSEDTYRTLMAADSAVMVIDGSKGVEAQTIKLFKVCVMRHIPIFTFINKMDRDARDSFELLDDIETVLGIRTCPINWPIGSGKDFKGVYDRDEPKTIRAFHPIPPVVPRLLQRQMHAMDDPALEELARRGSVRSAAGRDRASGRCQRSDFDLEQVQNGELSPVFFGSALTNFRCGDLSEVFPADDHTRRCRATSDEGDDRSY